MRSLLAARCSLLAARCSLALVILVALIGTGAPASAQQYFVMFHNRVEASSEHGSTEMTRQSEGSGLGSNFENVPPAAWIWFYSVSDPSLGGLPGRLDTAPGADDTTITIRFRIEAPVYQKAVVATESPPLANEEITLFYMGQQLFPVPGFMDTFEIMIPGGTATPWNTERKIIEIRAHAEDGSSLGDAEIEEFQFVVDDLTSSTDPNITLTPGWHKRRLLVEDSQGDAASPPSKAGNCVALCNPLCPQILTDPQLLNLQIGHTVPWMSKDPATNCAVSGESGHCQQSVKVMAEGLTGGSGYEQHMGYRFQNQDEQSLLHTICGCQSVMDEDVLVVELEVTGSAQVRDLNNPLSSDDYILSYRSAGNTYDIQVNGTQAFIEVRRDDYVGPACYTGYTAPGFGLWVETLPNDNDTASCEDIVLRTVNGWVGSVSGQTFNVGWNDVARFIVEEGQGQ